MHSISNLMQALSSLDAYEFEWRNGELFIELKGGHDAQAAEALARTDHVEQQGAGPIAQARD